jgi:aspartyl-tRNA synthetase
MLDHLGQTKRTHNCGELRREHVGQTVTLMGWVNSRRDHGPLLFVHLRDREGITQVVFDAERSADAHAKAKEARGEYVLAITGKCVLREESNFNANMTTGEIEIIAEDIKILNDSRTPPFQIERCDASEDVRLEIPLSGFASA